MVAAILFPIGKDASQMIDWCSERGPLRLFHIRVDGNTQRTQLDRPYGRDFCVHHSFVHNLSRRILLPCGHLLHICIISIGGTEFVQ